MLAAACSTTADRERAAAEAEAQPEPQRPAVEPREVPLVGEQLRDRDTEPPQLDVEPQRAAPPDIELQPPDTGPDRQRVALLLPLSGDNAGLGRAMQRAAQLALFDIADKQFELIVRDTEGTADGAKTAARAAVDAGANLILGPVFSSSVRAVTPVARGARVPVLAFSNNRRVAQAGVYVMGHMPGPQVQRVVGFASSRGLSRFAALVPDNGYGEIVTSALREAARRTGGELAAHERFEPGSRDVSGPVKRLSDYGERKQALKERIAEVKQRNGDGADATLDKLKTMDALGQAPFDAVLVPVGGKRLKAVAPMLSYYDVDPSEVQFLGTSTWADPSLGTEPALVGGWFAAPSPKGWKRFAGQYQDAYGEAPPRLASLAYDATALAAVLARQAPEGERTGPSVYAADRLTQRSGFAGVDGLFRLSPDGMVERRYAVMEMQRNELKVLDPAPDSFRAVTN
ncbi:amino acid/amide ABC transporter substrate-binding protein, HAAT family [Limimonas halophila]|uniref:Amino acid/amide ABC transporter substrate-binding protein, HAAT family n=1 Tax=Limimonas halophila TaxID=1082479 RepID=A0A1G7T475_9PROT|nr:amino acid/amide ABC transporter substrate-binding protein, HAAT family [Limimonas halophila]